MAKTEQSEQKMSGVKSGGKVVQVANAAARQTMEKIDAAGNVEQLIKIVGNETAAIASELEILRSKLITYDPNATAELDRLEKAHRAAERGDSSGIVSSLRGAGRWVVDLAKDAGASIVAEIIEKQMGW